MRIDPEYGVVSFEGAESRRVLASTITVQVYNVCLATDRSIASRGCESFNIVMNSSTVLHGNFMAYLTDEPIDKETLLANRPRHFHPTHPTRQPLHVRYWTT